MAEPNIGTMFKANLYVIHKITWTPPFDLELNGQNQKRSINFNVKNKRNVKRHFLLPDIGQIESDFEPLLC